MSHYKVGICGVGFVGNAVLQFLTNKKEIDIVAYDKYKHSEYKEISDFSQLLSTDLLYICLPTPYSNYIKTYFLKEINTILEALAAS